MRHTTALRRAIAAITLIAIIGPFALPGSADGAGTISGVAFEDLNRNGTFDDDETPLVDHQLFLFAGVDQTYLGTTLTDSAGRYSFTGLADADYSVEYAASSWTPLKLAWVPSTTGSIHPRHTVHLTGSATADFGWRPIVRSTTLGSPITSVVGPSGLRVESYNDAVSAQTIHDAVATALVGAEAPTVTVRFDYGTANATTSGAQQVDGRYTSYSAASYTLYRAWLDNGDQTLIHEYGHAWSLYYAHIVQQDPSLASYVAARGLTGDPRLNSSNAWSVFEMIAEDYRQLFGSPDAASRRQANTQVPPAASVPGLEEFLETTFTAPPPTDPAPTSGEGGDGPVAQLSVTELTVTPQPVVKSGKVTFRLSGAATVTVRILDERGAVVRTLLSNAARAAGATKLTWDRKSDAGRRVGAGTYRAVVDASAAALTASASATFRAS